MAIDGVELPVFFISHVAIVLCHSVAHSLTQSTESTHSFNRHRTEKLFYFSVSRTLTVLQYIHNFCAWFIRSLVYSYITLKIEKIKISLYLKNSKKKLKSKNKMLRFDQREADYEDDEFDVEQVIDKRKKNGRVSIKNNINKINFGLPIKNTRVFPQCD